MFKLKILRLHWLILVRNSCRLDPSLDSSVSSQISSRHKRRRSGRRPTRCWSVWCNDRPTCGDNLPAKTCQHVSKRAKTLQNSMSQCHHVIISSYSHHMYSYVINVYGWFWMIFTCKNYTFQWRHFRILKSNCPAWYLHRIVTWRGLWACWSCWWLIGPQSISETARGFEQIWNTFSKLPKIQKTSRECFDVCLVFYVYVLFVTGTISRKHCSVSGFGTGYSWVREDHSPSELAKLSKNVRTMASLIPKIKHINQTNRLQKQQWSAIQICATFQVPNLESVAQQNILNTPVPKIPFGISLLANIPVDCPASLLWSQLRQSSRVCLLRVTVASLSWIPGICLVYLYICIIYIYYIYNIVYINIIYYGV